MSFYQLLRAAVHGVTSNKLRSALTALGVIIGVASVIAMLALGTGARAAVEANFRFLGADNIQISARQMVEDGMYQPVGQILSFEDGLLMADAVEMVDRVEISIQGSAKLRHDRTLIDATVTGTTAAVDQFIGRAQVQPVQWPEGRPLSAEAFIERGRFYTGSEVLAAADVCVLGSETAEALFAGEDPLGEIVWVNRQRCTVIGVLRALEAVDPAERVRNKPNSSFFMPISTAIVNLYEDEPSVQVTAFVRDESRMGEAKAQIVAFLRARHAIEPNADGSDADDFTLTTRADVLGAQQEAARTFSLLLAAMASISLVVGGIGIMNVMLVSVRERTREIGLRMAVGARPRDILGQFLLEAMLISVVGGVAGTILGILAVPLAATLFQRVALLAVGSIPLALGVAMVTGILFGVYPALYAARLNPIEALRYE